MKKHLEHQRRKLRKHAWTSLAYFVALLLALTSSIMAWGPIKADDTITISARVGDVIVGPTTPVDSDDSDGGGGGGSSSHKKSKSSNPAEPVVSIEPAGSTTFSYVTDTKTGQQIPEFTTEKPAFQGGTNIKDALILLRFRYGGFSMLATTRADAAGKWYWQSPELFPDGSLQVDVTAQNPKEPAIRALAHLDFLVRSGKQIPGWGNTYQSTNLALFEVRVDIPERFQVVAPGDELVANVTLVNVSSPTIPANADVEYIILNEAGNIVSQTKEVLTVNGELNFLKSFYTQPSLAEGKYQLVVRVPAQNVLAIGSSAFTLSGKGTMLIGSIGRVDYTVIFQVLVGLTFLFILLTYFEFMRFLSVKRHIAMVTDKKFKSFIP